MQARDADLRPIRPGATRWCTLLSAVIVLTVAAVPVVTHAPSGAIFTTVADGFEVNWNQFPTKESAYLTGGPGVPQAAAGLDDGTYVFQVTDPSGKALLSSDSARCRLFTVSRGVFSSVAPADDRCEHDTGADTTRRGITIQLFPFFDTPNRGGVNTAWVTRLQDFFVGCSLLGVTNALDVVDCGVAPGNDHGFLRSESKTDNFEVLIP